MTKNKKPSGAAGKKGDCGRGGGLKVRVKTARGRKNSSTRWLQRQLNDPYVAKAKKDGYRSRAAYKLIEIDEKYSIFRNGMRVVDLGAAPGSWLQVIGRRVKNSRIVGIDLQEIEPIEGVNCIHGDFLEEEPYQAMLAAVKGPVDVVLSDMAAAACGHTQTDHIRIMYLCEMSLEFAIETLKPEGAFVAKLLRGGAESELQAKLKKHFTSVKYFKPSSSRQDSAEMYVVGLGFRKGDK